MKHQLIIMPITGLYLHALKLNIMSSPQTILPDTSMTTYYFLTIHKTILCKKNYAVCIYDLYIPLQYFHLLLIVIPRGVAGGNPFEPP